MPDPTNQFQISPTISETVNTPNYLNRSEGFIGDSSVGAAIKGVSDVLDMAIKTTDQFFKNKSADETHQRIGDARTDAIMEGFQEVKDLTSPGVPSPLKDAGAELYKMESAKAQGRMRDTYYWARMDTIAKELRAKYPGYRDHIDNTIANILGTTPANALVKALNRETEVLRANNKDPIDQYLQANKDYLSPETVARAVQRDPNLTMGDLQLEVSRNAYSKAQLAKAQAALNYAQDQRKDTKEAAGIVYDVRAHQEFSTLWNPARATLDALTKQADDELLKQGKVSPETIQKTRAWIADTKQKLATRQAALGASTDFAGLDPKVREASNKNYMDLLDNVASAVENGRLSSTAQSVKAILEDSQYLALGAEQIKLDATLSKLMHPQLAEKYLKAGTDVGRLSEGQELIRRSLLSKIALGQMDLPTAIDTARRYQLPDKVLTDILIKPNDLLKDNNTPAEIKKATYEFLFGKGAEPSNVLRLAKTLEDQRIVFNQWTNPAVYQSIKKESNNDPTLIENYRRWIQRGAQTVYNRELADIRDTTSNANMILIDWDGKGYVAKPNPAFQSRVGTQSVLLGTVASWNRGRLAGVNKAIENLTPVWNDLGLDPKEESLKMLGITLESIDNAGPDSPLKPFRNLYRTEGRQIPNADVGTIDLPQISEEDFAKMTGDKGVSREALNTWLNLQFKNQRDFPQYYPEYRPENRDRLSTNIEDVTTEGRVGAFAAPGLLESDWEEIISPDGQMITYKRKQK